MSQRYDIILYYQKYLLDLSVIKKKNRYLLKIIMVSLLIFDITFE